ncbi:PH domain-containing protein [Paenibacillus herberti]|uniref:YdbS-like PH domain-containing protein n=1 Tax=Paenibacillus herberti TaxID=1619309 RepID=A0A229NY38_9BACL|nr:PH domain-containing protein [Paenibacillus herberti]OXM14823.1 hypothetical protein CGZ75_18305 [Paenibacillus herberti]
MMKSNPREKGEMKRLHPISILFFCAKGLKEMYGFLPILPLIVLWGPRVTGMEVSRFWLTLVVASLAVALLVLTAWLRWSRFLYVADATAISIEHGVWTRQNMWIQRERIQSIDTTQNIADRMFGLIQLRIETAGGEKPEAVLPSLSAAEAQRIQYTLGFAGASAGLGAGGEVGREVPLAAVGLQPQADSTADRLTPEWHQAAALEAAHSTAGLRQAAASTVQGEGALAPHVGSAAQGAALEDGASRKISPVMLWSYALTSYKTGFVFLILVGIISRLADNWFKDIDLLDLLSTWLGSSWLLISLPILFLLAWAITTLELLNSNFGFRIQRINGKLKVEKGLLEKKQQTIELERIQALQIVQPILHRPFGWFSVRASITGNLDEKEKSFVLFPILRKSETEAFLQEFAPAFHIPETWNKVERSAWMPYAGWPTLIAMIVVVPGLIWIPEPYHWFSLLLPLFVLLTGWLEHRNAGWAQGEGQLAISGGGLEQVQVLIPKRRIQWRRMSQNRMQDRSSRATLRISLAAGKGEQSFKLRHAPADAVLTLLQEASTRQTRVRVPDRLS